MVSFIRFVYSNTPKRSWAFFMVTSGFVRFGIEATTATLRSPTARLLRYNLCMRYLVRARVRPGCEAALLKAIEAGTLGEGSVAEGEYLRNMNEARLCPDETARWVEVCYCPTPLQEERPYWEEYFELTKVQGAHDGRKCKDRNGSEPSFAVVMKISPGLPSS